jgi:hypothetical protein
VSTSSYDDTDCTEDSVSEFDSELDLFVNMRVQDDQNAPDRIDFDGNVDMEREFDDEVEEDELEEDEEAEDEDEEDAKEPQTIGQGELENASADDVDTMVDDQPTVLLEQGQVM